MKTKNKLCPVGTEVQTVIFDKSNFNESSAKKWAKSNDLKYGYVDEKDKTYRIRQQEPDYFVNGSLRTIDFTKGVKAVIGCPKPKYRKFEYGGEADDMLTGTWTGSFDNNYEGKNPLDVWNNWTQEQKRHFLYDHYQEIIFREKNYYESGKIKEKVIAKEGINEYIKITNYNSLPLVIREAVLDHTIMGQYSSGGQIDVNDGCIQETIRLIDEDKKIHDWFIDSHNKKLVIIFDNELKLNEVDRINSLLKDFYICHDIIDTEVLPVFDSEYRMITLDLKTDKFEIMGSFGAGGVVDEFQPKTQIVLETPPMFSSFRMGASQSDFPAMVNKAGYMFVDVSNHTKTSYNITIQIEESRFKINDKVEGLKYLEKQEYSWFNSTTYMAYYIKTKSLLEIQYHIEKNIEKLMPSIKLDGLILKVYKSNAVNQIISTTPELQLEKATASKSDKPEIPAKTESKPETSETKKSDQPKTENPTDNPSEVESEVRRLVELAKKYEKEGKFGLVLKKKDGSKAVLAYPQQYPSMFPEDEWFVVYSSVKESETSDDAPDYELLNKMLDYVKELFKYIKLSQEELDSIRVSVNNSRKKIGLQNTEYQKGGGIGNKGIYIIKVNNTYGNYVIEDKHGFSEIRKKYRYQATKYDTLEKAQESLIRLKKQWNDTDYIIVRVTNSFFKKYSNGGGVGIKLSENDNKVNYYHATYLPLLESIKEKGLGGTNKKMWEFSEDNVVYLTTDLYDAISFAETSEELEDEDWLEQIIVLVIPAKNLLIEKLEDDKNNEGTYEYHDIIPFDKIERVIMPNEFQNGGGVENDETTKLLNLLEQRYLYDQRSLRLMSDKKQLENNIIDWENEDNFLGKLYQYQKKYEIIGDYKVLYIKDEEKIKDFKNKIKELKSNGYSVIEKVSKPNKQENKTYMFIAVKRKYESGGEVQNNDKYSISKILSKTDFDEQTKKSMIEDFVNAGYKNVYSLKTQENLSDEFKIEQTADNIMNSINWNYSMSDANTIAEIIHSIKEDKEPEKAKWNLTVTGETPEKDEGFWENYKSVTLSDTQPDSGRYMGYKWVEMSIKDGVPEGYWEKIVTEIPEVKVPVKDVNEIEYSLQILEYLNKLLGRKLDKSFLIGKRVELKKMKGESQMPEGMTGIIDSIDGIGQFHIKWDNGSSLALIPEEDEFKVFFAGGEILVGGKGDKLTLQQIAKKHNVPLSMIQKQFLLGIKFESEHTSDKKMQQEIVKDHLSEFPNYYTALKGMETYLERMKEGKSDSGLYLDIDKTIDSMYFLVPLSIQGVKYLEVPSEFPDKRRIQFYSDKDFDKAVINYSKSKLKNQVSA